jgi:hypothetical protein
MQKEPLILGRVSNGAMTIRQKSTSSILHCGHPTMHLSVHLSNSTCLILPPSVCLLIRPLYCLSICHCVCQAVHVCLAVHACQAVHACLAVHVRLSPHMFFYLSAFSSNPSVYQSCATSPFQFVRPPVFSRVQRSVCPSVSFPVNPSSHVFSS